MVNKNNIRASRPSEQIKVEPDVAMVKDLLVDNIDGYVIYFCDEATRVAKPDTKDKNKPVVGMPIVSVKIGDHFYHGLCDVGASVSAIPFTLYQEIRNDIAPAGIEDIDATLQKKYTSVMIRVCHSRSHFLSCMYNHDDFMIESR